MAEYITREEAYEAAYEAYREQRDEPLGFTHDPRGYIYNHIGAVAAADVVLVVRSRIVDVQEYNDQRYNSEGELQDCYFVAGKCEACGNEVVSGWSYCPYCGARMTNTEMEAPNAN